VRDVELHRPKAVYGETTAKRSGGAGRRPAIMGEEAAMQFVADSERDCLRRYCELLRDRLGGRLVEVRIFGSAARGDMWPPHSPMHSDIDLLVLTCRDVSDAEQEQLLNETYPLYLECGRQLSPHFFTEQQFNEPDSDLTRAFFGRVRAEGRTVWSSAGAVD
jgi:predicted nucleotidyltransferase